MPARPILFDATRLLTRLSHRAPTGIDRVDLAYANRVLTGPEAGDAVALTPFGARLLPPERRDALLRTIAARWGETTPDGEDRAFAGIRSWLAGDVPAPSEPAPEGRRAGRVRAVRDVLETRAWTADAFRWRRAERAPAGAVYLHTSHIRLDRPELFGWLDGRPDIRPVFFVHDLIPIDFPEYGVPGEAERHRRRMATVASRGAAVLVNSADVGERFGRHLAGAGLPSPPLRVAPLGAEPAFSASDGVEAVGGRPYFVVTSTIEARKNHLLLLQVWRDLAGRMGADTPALVVVGRRGWESEAAVDLLDRCEAIRPHVREASGLSTAGLAALVRGARAALLPSFAEGYGIPVVEALSLGTPVIASDIAVHREVAGRFARLVDPLDGPGWRAAVLAALAGDAPRPVGYVPPRWDAHFALVDDAIGRL